MAKNPFPITSLNTKYFAICLITFNRHVQTEPNQSYKTPARSWTIFIFVILAKNHNIFDIVL
jgi:hypothetical protein